jgi:hypothetical protein
MYKSSLRHIHDPVLSSLKMKGIGLPIYYIVDSAILNSKIKRKSFVAHPPRQWLHERATVLRYTHIASLVTERPVIFCIKFAFTIMNVCRTICGLVGKAFNIERVGTLL